MVRSCISVVCWWPTPGWTKTSSFEIAPVASYIGARHAEGLSNASWRGQLVVLAEANELGAGSDHAGDLAGRGVVQEARDQQVDAVMVVGAEFDEGGVVGIAAEVRDGRQARVDGGQPVGERGAERDPEAADARCVHIVAAGEIGEGGGMVRQHAPDQRPAVPDRRLGGGAFARLAAFARTRHVEAERHIAGAGENRPGRMEQIRAAVEQFVSADVEPIPVRMRVEDRRSSAAGVDRPREQAAHLAGALQVERQAFNDVAVLLDDVPPEKRKTRLAERQQRLEVFTRDRHCGPGPFAAGVAWVEE